MIDSTQFKLIKIGIASPEDVIEWARGPQNEVTKPETIQYSSFKPVPDGLFCERIFGPTKDYECHCKRYKKIKYKGQTCPNCQVDVTTSKVRRERMGYIKLLCPVSHIWYLKTVPSPISLLLDMQTKNLEHVLYYREYLVTHADTDQIEQLMPLINKAIDMFRDSVNAECKQDIEDLKEAYGDEADPEKLQDQIRAFEEFHTKKIHDLEKGREVLESKKERDVIESDDYGYFKKLRDQVNNRELMGDDAVDLYRFFRADIGAEAVKTLLKKLDLKGLRESIVREIQSSAGSGKQIKLIKRLEVIDSFLESGSRPEWMILENIPVIPPDLRPMVQLDGGRFATSDLNDLYRRVINRNNTLNKIITAKAPQIMVNHQKNLIQEAVDALIDNDRKQRKVNGSNGRALKSLSDMLKGKEGRFRKNLLGKRVDYSGRSVIVVGPSLKIYQCGLPKEMALELFKPFVMKEMVKRGLVSNIKLAKKSIDRMDPTVWDPLEEVISEHPVLLNRAPTLHRLGIQAFEPILVDGKAIQLHPLVCAAFNADFDGDQMAVHVPLSAAAQAEARTLMLASHNLFSPANGKPIVAPSQDVVLGCFYVTMRSNKWALKYADKDTYGEDGELVAGAGQTYVVKDGQNRKCRFFANPKDAMLCYETGNIDIHEPICVRMTLDGRTMLRVITAGRLIFNSILPDNMGYIGTPFVKGDLFEYDPGQRLALDSKDQQNVTEGKEPESNEKVAIGKKWCGSLITECHERNGHDVTVTFLDAMKALGYKYATKAGMSIAITDMDITSDRETILKDTEAEVNRINMNFNAGMVSAQVRRESVLQRWLNAQEDIGKSLIEGIEQFNQIAIITMSGARGSTKQISQLAGMRGLMSDPMGNAIEDMPVKSNFHEGLSVLEYFVSTHGARKGLADTALRTADAGYLTRRLVDVAQDVIIREDDCHTDQGISVKPLFDDEGNIIEEMEERIKGRTALRNIGDPNLYTVDENVYMFLEPVLETKKRAVDDPEKAIEAELERLTEEINGQTWTSPEDKQEALAQAEEEAKKAGYTLTDQWSTRDSEPVYIRESRLAEWFAASDKFDWSDGKVVFRETGEVVPDGCLTLQTEAGGIDPEKAIAVRDEIISDAKAKEIDRLYTQLKEKHEEDPNVIVPVIMVRSPFTCKSTMGVCAKCYGRDLSLKIPVEVGTAVGIIAAQSIGEPGTQLTMRTFHGGGVAGKYLTGVANVKKKKQETLRIIHSDSASGILKFDESGKDTKDKNKQVQNLMKVLEDQVHGLLRVQELFEARRPKGQAIVADVDGTVIEANQGETNQVTIRSRQKICTRPDAANPEKTVFDKEKMQSVLGKRLGADLVKPEVIADLWNKGWKIDVKKTGAESLTVRDDFEGKPIKKSAAENKYKKGVVWDCKNDSGTVNEKILNKALENGIDEIYVDFNYLVPHRGNLMVREGQEIEHRGHRITEGPLDPHKILELEGENGLMSYVVDEIQKVYKSQGVDINDKHVEVIVRQMLRKVKVTDPGSTDLKKEQLVDKAILEIKNKAAIREEKEPAGFVPVLKGITDASLATESFLSAASFQKTTRILTTAAVKNKKDHLIGIKENVIIGRLIPAGTGLRKFRDLKLYDKEGNILSLRRRNYAPETDNTPLERFVWTKAAKDTMAALGCVTVSDLYARINEIRGKGANIEKEIFSQLTDIIKECSGNSNFRLDFRKISAAAELTDEEAGGMSLNDEDEDMGGMTDSFVDAVTADGSDFALGAGEADASDFDEDNIKSIEQIELEEENDLMSADADEEEDFDEEEFDADAEEEENDDAFIAEDDSPDSFED